MSATEYYNHSTFPAQGSSGSSAAMRAELESVETGFGKLPDLSGNGSKVVAVNAGGTALEASVAPALGNATATTINKLTLTQPATGATLTLTDGKTFAVAKTLTLTGTDGTTMTFPATSASVARIDAANTFLGTQTFSGLGQFNLGLTVSGAAFNSRGITDNATATALTLSGSGANSVTIANSATNPTISTSAGDLIINATGNDVFIGSSVLQVSAAGALVNISSAGTNSTQLAINKTVSAMSGTYPAMIDLNHAAFAGGNPFGIAWRSSSRYDWIGHLTTSGRLGCVVNTSGTPINVWVTDTSGNLSLGGDQGAESLRVVPVAGSARWITATGSAGGNPTIGTSAGSLDFSPVGQGISLRVTTGGASTVNYFSLSGSTTGGRLTLLATGSDTNVGSSWQTKGSGSHLFVTETGASAQVEITHTASANRYITLTGANAANPKIATSAGSLDIGSPVVLTAQTVGTTVGAAGGASALPATPLGYLTTSINGTACKIPYYNT